MVADSVGLPPEFLTTLPGHVVDGLAAISSGHRMYLDKQGA